MIAVCGDFDTSFKLNFLSSSSDRIGAGSGSSTFSLPRNGAGERGDIVAGDILAGDIVAGDIFAGVTVVGGKITDGLSNSFSDSCSSRMFGTGNMLLG